MSWRAVHVLSLLAGLLLLPGFAAATMQDGIIVTVTATDTNGETGGFTEFLPAVGIMGDYSWSLDEPKVIKSAQNTVLGTITTLGLAVKEDPAVALDFSLQAGQYGTNFTITSAVVSFAQLATPKAYATSVLTVTDTDHDGAKITGLLNGASYQAKFNGTPWASLITSPVVAPVFDSNSAADKRPAVGTWELVGFPVSSMSAGFSFALTPLDLASGVSMFEVVPEPTTIGFMVLVGGLLLVRRR